MKKLTVIKDETCSFCGLMKEYLADAIESDSRFQSIRPEFVDYSESEAAKYDNYFVPAFYINDELVCDGPADRDEIVTILERVIGD